MLHNMLVVRDYETGSRNPLKCQPTQLAACIINPKSLEVLPDSLFNVMIEPVWDEEECKKQDIDPIQQDALNKCKFTKESFANAVPLKLAWENYCNYLKKYNRKGESGGTWDAPHVVGFNSLNFDDVIDMRMCERFGPKLNDRGDMTIYHPTVRLDLFPMFHMIFNNVRINPTNSQGMDALRDYLGADTDLAHRGDFDVLQEAFILVKVLKLFRSIQDGSIHLPLGKKIKFHDCFTQENKMIKDILGMK